MLIEEDPAVLLSEIMKDTFNKIDFVRKAVGGNLNYSPEDNLAFLVIDLFHRVERLETIIQRKKNETKV